MDIQTLKRLCNDRSFARGEEYFNNGRVRSLADHEGVLLAIVSGQNDYNVRLVWEDGEVEYSCDCPIGLEGEFCKHLVATGLALINLDMKPSPRTGGRKAQATTQEKIQDFLSRQDKSTLIQMLTEETAENQVLREFLLLQAARCNPAGVDLVAYRKAIENATRTDGYVGYGAVSDFARRVQQVIDSIAALHNNDHPAEVIQLTEYMFGKLEDSLGDMDDSNGYMDGILLELYDLHHEACLEAKPDPISFARQLFDWEIKSDLEVFGGSALNYADVFGSEGLTEYRRLAEAEWGRVRPLGPGESDEEHLKRRCRITSIMETLAGQTGDPEAIVEVKRRDLSHSRSFLKITEIYTLAGENDKALAWAEKGLNSFPVRDSQLVEFLAQEYHRRDRHEDAMNLIWEQFVESPSLGRYQQLNAHAVRVKPNSTWQSWREKALAHIRSVIGGEKRNQNQRNWQWFDRLDNSRLVEILLWEKRYDEAWQEATRGGCSDSLWIRVATTREEKHPEDAIPIYREKIVTILKLTNNSVYDEAVNFVRRIRDLETRLGREKEFGSYLFALCLEYKRKRNFMKLLQEFKK